MLILALGKKGEGGQQTHAPTHAPTFLGYEELKCPSTKTRCRDSFFFKKACQMLSGIV